MKEKEPHWKDPLSALALIGVLYALSGFFMGKRLPQIWNALATTPEQRVWAETMATMTAAGGLIIGFLSIFLTWIISTGVLYFIARVLGGRGDLVRFGKIMGWCMAPYVFNAVVGLIVAIRFPIRIFLPIPFLPIPSNSCIMSLMQLLEILARILMESIPS